MEGICCPPMLGGNLYVPQPRYHYSMIKRVEEEKLNLASQENRLVLKERMSNGFHDNKQISDRHGNLKTMIGDLDLKGETKMETNDTVARVNGDIVEEKKHDEKYKSDERVPSPNLSEEDKIKEFMSRSDTAVIFPEPVSDQEDVEQHEQMDHDSSNDDSFLLKCQHCDKVFPQLYVLQDHMRTFHAAAIDRNTCPKCNEKFSNKNLLDKHMALHSITSQSCKVCHKTFANIYRLQRHMISHDESSDLRKFKCPECGKAFKFKHHLKEHVRIHSGEKPFQCNHCGKRFSHSGSYSSHMTSKKCWPWAKNMVNRRLNGKDVPQKLDSELDLHPVTSYGNSYNFPRPFISQCPPISPHFAPLLSGVQPFLPYGPFPSNLLAPMMHGLPSPFPCLPPNFSKLHPFMNEFEKTKEKMGYEKHSVQSLLGLSDKDGEEAKIKEIKDEDEHPLDVTKETNEMNSSLEKSESDSADARSVGEDERRDVKTSDLDDGCTSEDGSPSKVEGSNGDLKRILEIVERTVTQQIEHQSKDEKQCISRLNGVNHSSEENNLDSVDGSAESKSACVCTYCDEKFDSAVKLHQHERYLCAKNSSIIEMKNDWLKTEPMRKGDQNGSKDCEDDEGKSKCFDMMCRFCDEVFQSAVQLHQHERYLCKNNNDIPFNKDKVEVKMESDRALDGERDESQRNSSDEDDDSDCEEKDGGEKIKCRVRSLISEEQLQVLRAYYEVNPRPRKYELIRIGNEIGFPKRVVQVWFQNMRARDRKRGKEVPYFPNMARSRRPEELSTPESMDFPTKPSSLFPMIPKPFNGALPARPLVIPQITPPPHAHSFNPFLNSIRPCITPPKVLPTSSQAEPLDLSLTKRESPSPAHCSTPSKSPNGLVENGLNLSIKKEPLTESDRRYTLKQSMFPSMQSPNSNIVADNRGFLFNRMQESGLNLVDRNGNFCSNSKLSPFETRIPRPMSASHASGHTTDDSSCDNSLDGHMLEHSINSPGSFSDSVFSHSTNHSFDEFSKFSREKMMRMDAREYSPDFLDGVMGDDDMAKKRKSWKHHKIDVDEGMYACDQCEKMFSKQSSLARHKYEHSGARPFACDICRKAFKHKHHLTEHKRLHSGEKPFQCKKCGKRFSHSGSYSQHMNHRYKYCKPTNGTCKMEDDETETTDIPMMV